MKRLITSLAVVLAGCSVTVTGGGWPVVDNAGWTRSANYTTCDQWSKQMTDAQRVAMVRPILPVLRRTVDTAATAGDELVPAFAQAITAACASPDLASYNGDYVITAAATFVFTMPTGKQFQP